MCVCVSLFMCVGVCVCVCVYVGVSPGVCVCVCLRVSVCMCVGALGLAFFIRDIGWWILPTTNSTYGRVSEGDSRALEPCC